MFQPFVSIIIVTYNNNNVIQECLEALSRQTYQNFEVIAVDNNSRDNTVDIVSRFSDINLIESDENLGFAGGNSLGLQYSKGNYIALLNPDTEPEVDWLEELVKCMNKDGQVGICASKLIVYGTNSIDSAGDGCTSTGRGFKIGEGKTSEDQFDNTGLVFGACGGAMMIRRETIEHIGFLDDDFFLIYEDTDFCFRAQLAGWNVVYAAKAIVHHKVRSSIGILSDIAVYYSIRNSRFVLVKNMPIFLILKYLHHHLVQEIGSIVYFCIKHGRWQTYIKANIDFIKILPQMLKKRKKNMLLKVRTDKDIELLLIPLWNKAFIIDKLKKMIKS